jgi:hypothetical protein
MDKKILTSLLISTLIFPPHIFAASAIPSATTMHFNSVLKETYEHIGTYENLFSLMSMSSDNESHEYIKKLSQNFSGSLPKVSFTDSETFYVAGVPEPFYFHFADGSLKFRGRTWKANAADSGPKNLESLKRFLADRPKHASTFALLPEAEAVPWLPLAAAYLVVGAVLGAGASLFALGFAFDSPDSTKNQGKTLAMVGAFGVAVALLWGPFALAMLVGKAGDVIDSRVTSDQIKLDPKKLTCTNSNPAVLHFTYAGDKQKDVTIERDKDGHFVLGKLRLFTELHGLKNGNESTEAWRWVANVGTKDLEAFCADQSAQDQLNKALDGDPKSQTAK